MCDGPESELCLTNSIMEGGFQNQKDGIPCTCSNLLEFSASDDLLGFIHEVEERGSDVDELSFWYGRRFGSSKMGFEERTPLMIAAIYGSTRVLKYIIDAGRVNVNRSCSSDGVTALHCAAAGGSDSSLEVVELLLDASADASLVDANGNKPGDLIAPALKSSCSSRKRTLEKLLKGENVERDFPSPSIYQITCLEEEGQQMKTQQLKEGNEKKEYPVDVSLPDINNGIYSTDEFRMYSFKVKPCSRAYSHDWTECPFVHPGENARRRDPRKYPYSCVPCPEFRKGTCRQGDACEYAHGVFECWLHPAQYRTRLCKDETNCSRKVCFFAHKQEELRPLYASTGSGIPSPRSLSGGAPDMAAISPLTLSSSSSSLVLPPTSTPPLSPSAAASSPKSGSMWNKVNHTPPSLQLPGSRLKSALNARDLDLEMELLGLDVHHSQQHQSQKLMDELSSLSSQSSWNSRIGELNPSNLDDVFGGLDASLLSQFQGLSLKATTQSQLQSPTGLQMRQNMNQLRASYPSNISSSPARKASSFGLESPRAVAAAVMNSRSAAFSKRSQSFADRGAATNCPGLTAATTSAALMSSSLSGWSSPDGKLDWGIQGEELNKLKKSASFAFRGSNAAATMASMRSAVEEPDVSWVHSLVKDVTPVGFGPLGSEQPQFRRSSGVHEMIPPWVEQLYIEQEQMVA
ncbi:zinc finger CCCH domain-containing protein 29-like [Malania oleifera]|uniref:zinc finger CCCH domain-containing protein 29-like n=1 Tax=Malania oleifera TaxID=397392 RepID=UPI0025ADBAED|nr:zinc finger CCCH domain-containing protein 29-like [Malania oleifera]